MLAAQLGMSERVVFLGEVSERDLDSLYACAAAYVYSSPEDDFGLGVLEAMAHALPVIAWAYGGPTVTVRNEQTGLLAIPYEIEDFAAKIAHVLDDPAYNRALGANAIREVR